MLTETAATARALCDRIHHADLEHIRTLEGLSLPFGIFNRLTTNYAAHFEILRETKKRNWKL